MPFNIKQMQKQDNVFFIDNVHLGFMSITPFIYISCEPNLKIKERFYRELVVMMRESQKLLAEYQVRIKQG